MKYQPGSALIARPAPIGVLLPTCRAVTRAHLLHLLHLLLLAQLLQHSCAYHAHHHIYDEGQEEDVCAPADFGGTYWTAPDARGARLLGTAHAQRLIWQHQHPASCAGSTFLVWRACNHGIGSTWHIMGQVRVCSHI